MSLSLLVLAAGMGSRYGGLKQMDPVGPNKEVVLEYSVFDALQCGFDEVVFVLRREFEEAFREQILTRFESRIQTEVVFQELDNLPPGFTLPEGRRKPWGTGHAVWSARHAIKQPFVVINADDFYGRSAFQNAVWFFSRPGLGSSNAFMMSGFQLANTLSEHGPVARGVCRVDERRMLREVEEYLGIQNFPDGVAACSTKDEETRRFTGDEIVSLNFWGLTPKVFPLLEQHFRTFLSQHARNLKAEFYLPEAISEIVSYSQGTVAVLPTGNKWFGITYKDDRALVMKSIVSLVQAGEYPTDLWQEAALPTVLGR